jgi:hypothetical protein
MRSALLFVSLAVLLAAPGAAAQVGDEPILPGLVGGIISYCIWYLPDVGGGVGYCYDYETGQFCVQEPSGVEPCANIDNVPFLDADELMDFARCANDVIWSLDPLKCVVAPLAATPLEAEPVALDFGASPFGPLRL